MSSCTCSLAGALVVAHLLLSNSHQSLMLTREHHASISQPPEDKPRKKQKEELVTCKLASDLETHQGAPPQLVSVYSESIQAGSISLRHLILSPFPTQSSSVSNLQV